MIAHRQGITRRRAFLKRLIVGWSKSLDFSTQFTCVIVSDLGLVNENK